MKTLLFLLLVTSSQLLSAQSNKQINNTIDSLVHYIKNKHTEAFAKYTVYRGENLKRKWKDSYNPNKPEELKATKAVLVQLKEAFGECEDRTFVKYEKEIESEGTWHVYEYSCAGEKKLRLAFLKIKGRYMLGDIDMVEED